MWHCSPTRQRGQRLDATSSPGTLAGKAGAAGKLRVSICSRCEQDSLQGGEKRDGRRELLCRGSF